MLEFYGRALGLREVRSDVVPGGKLTRFAVGDGAVKLLALDAALPPAKPRAGFRTLGVAVEDLQAALRHRSSTVRAKGVDARHVADPDGNVLVLHQSDAPTVAAVRVSVDSSDLAVSRSFYEALLGLPTTEEPGEAAVSRSVIHLVGGRSVKAAGLAEAPGIRYLTLPVRSMDDTCARLAAANIAPAIPRRTAGEFEVCFAQDPGGNWIEFAARAGT